MRYLDCGCAIRDNGSRAWCPSCLEPAARTTKDDQIAALKAELETQTHLHNLDHSLVDQREKEIAALEAKLATKCGCQFQTAVRISSDPVLVMTCESHGILFSQSQKRIRELEAKLAEVKAQQVCSVHGKIETWGCPYCLRALGKERDEHKAAVGDKA